MEGYKLTEVRVVDTETQDTIKLYRNRHARQMFDNSRKAIHCAPFQCVKTDAGLRYTCTASSLGKFPTTAVAECYFEVA